MNEILNKIQETGIIPVVVLENSKDAEKLAYSLYNGGLPCAEVTFRTDAAEDSIRIMSEKYPNMLIGAGTVLTTGQVDRAIAAGAKFIVSPGFNPIIVKYCMEKNIVIIPGCCTPTEIEQALTYDLEVLKFFPAEPAGGLTMIKALAAPYTGVKFMPTGGITPKNVKDYLSYNRILACGGSWMVNADLIKEGNFDKVEALAKEASAIVKEVRETGYAFDNEENEDGIRCIAVSLPDFGKSIRYALSISAPLNRMDDARVKELVKYVLLIKEQILKSVFYRK